MLLLRYSRMFCDFNFTHFILVSSLMAVIWFPGLKPADCLSVPSLCMLEQRRLLNLTDQGKQRQEDKIIDNIQTICGGYIEYITCFTNNLPNSEEIGDRFSRLMYQPRSMFVAYKGLCHKDLDDLRKNKACLISSPDLMDCYKKYEKGLKKVIELQDQGTFTTGNLERLACNVSVGRYKCEIDAYSDCSKKAGEIMKDYIYASLSDSCRTRMGLTSRYTLLPDTYGLKVDFKKKEVVEIEDNSFQQSGESGESSSTRHVGVVNRIVKLCLDIVLKMCGFLRRTLFMKQ